MRNVSVVIPTRNRHALLARCLDSIAAQSYPSDEYEILVVHDDPNWEDVHESHDIGGKDLPRIRHLTQEHQGPAAARNHGTRVADGEIFAFIDDDCIADRFWLENLECKLGRSSGAEGRVEPLGKPGPITHGVCNYGGLYLTANVAYQKVWFTSVGGFDEQFRFPAGEDFDLAWRILDAGGEIKYAEKSIVYHPARVETFSAFRERMKASEAPYILASKHPKRFRRFAGRGPRTTAMYYTFVDPAYLLFRWRKEFRRTPSLLAPFALRMAYQSLFGATRPLRRVFARASGWRARLRVSPQT